MTRKTSLFSSCVKCDGRFCSAGALRKPLADGAHGETALESKHRCSVPLGWLRKWMGRCLFLEARKSACSNGATTSWRAGNAARGPRGRPRRLPGPHRLCRSGGRGGRRGRVKAASISEHGWRPRPAPSGWVVAIALLTLPVTAAACSGQELSTLPSPASCRQLRGHCFCSAPQTLPGRLSNSGSPSWKKFRRRVHFADEEAETKGSEIRSNSGIPFEPGDAGIVLTSF